MTRELETALCEHERTTPEERERLRLRIVNHWLDRIGILKSMLEFSEESYASYTHPLRVPTTERLAARYADKKTLDIGLERVDIKLNAATHCELNLVDLAYLSEHRATRVKKCEKRQRDVFAERPDIPRKRSVDRHE